MGHDHVAELAPMRLGIILALLTLMFGFGLGGVFGAFEENVKVHLKDKSQSVFMKKYEGDENLQKKILSKSWVYIKRAHLHANGLGTTSLILIFLLMSLGVSDALKKAGALLLGAGSLGYSVFWLLAGLKAPGLASTGLAKESLSWLAIPSSGACILGVITVLVLTLISLYADNARSSKP